MANSLPIRILIEGGSLTEREQVAELLRANPYAAMETQQTGTSESDLQTNAVPNRVSDDGRIILMGKKPAAAEAMTLPRAGNKVAAAEFTAETHAGQEAAARAVRESQRLTSIGRLAAEIAHEINNPLEAVCNLLYLTLHEQGLPERAVDFLTSAERELERVIQISKQTLNFTRESARPIPIHLAGLMDEVVSLYSRRIDQKSMEVVREYASTESIVALPGEIRQVFSNLVTNAIEASEPGGRLWLRIRDTRQFCAGRVKHGVRITVGDNGAGIPEAARKRLGEIFFTTKGESGTGLGLWVTTSIVSRYGGTMRLRSSTGARHGTVFSIFLPSMTEALTDQAEDAPDRGQAGNKVWEISDHPRHTANVRDESAVNSRSSQKNRG